MMMVSVFGFSQPTTNAPTPTHASTDVISIFSDAYTNVATNYNPYWGQTGSVTTNYEAVSGSGNNILVYSNFNYQGTELSTQNASAMEYLHVDVWTSTATVLKVSPINNGTGASETLVEIPLVNGGWSSVDLPKSLFTGMTWDSVFQFKFDGQSGANPSTVYLDNIYFWKSPVNPAADATLSDLKVNGTTVFGFSPAITTYSIQFPQGTTVVPQITSVTTSNTNASNSITQATTIPGTATVLVTAQDGTTTKTYTVNYKLSGPSVAAPTPPARLASDVISLFSNAYTNIAVSEWSTSWDDSSVTDIQVQGDDVKKIDFTNFLGIQLGNFVNASEMTYFHMDYFIDNGTDLVGKVINTKWSNHANAPTAGETSAFLLNTVPTTTGTWVSVDVPISSFDNAPQIRNALYQLLFISNLGTLYVDNIYLHKNTVLGVDDVNASKNKLSFYPNPVNAGEVINVKTKAKNIEIYNVSGQKVKSSNSQTVSSQGLTKGIYIIKITSESGEAQTSKLIVK